MLIYSIAYPSVQLNYKNCRDIKAYIINDKRFSFVIISGCCGLNNVGNAKLSN